MSTTEPTPRIRWFRDLTLADSPSVGGKGANLGEMTRAGLPVPPGFVVVHDAYLAALDEAGLRAEANALRPEPRDDLAAAAEEFARVARAGTELVRRAGLPAELRAELVTAYHHLGPEVAVAVRSSAPAEDSAAMSFAGIHESFTNVSGPDALVEAVLGCWASLWSSRAVAYRDAQGFDDEPSVAVVVQQMVRSDRSGVLFTADPRTGARDRVVIEAAFGLGEVVVGGQVEPDNYVLDKGDLQVLEVRIGHQVERLVGTDSGQERQTLTAGESTERVLTDAQLRALGELARRVEDHYGSPQDMEWAFAGDELFVVQTRPITTLGEDPAGGATATGSGAAPGAAASSARVLATGLAAGPGVVSGKVRILHSPKDSHRLEQGEILVAAMTDPDWLPALRRAGAIVTDHGGITCHAAIVGRELHRPVVVAARTATKDLVDGQVVTVDGGSGVVLEGDVAASLRPAAEPAGGTATAHQIAVETTATSVFVNLAVPDDAERVAALPVDGVGLLRAEFMITEALDGLHPSRLLELGRRDEYVAAMAAGVSRIAAAFTPRPVIYRAVDLRSNEFRGLEGGEVEAEERNPMIGYRGCFRYVTEPELFRLDLDVIHAVRQRYPNVHLMIPFVRTKWELEACLHQIDEHPLGRDRKLQRWIMAEVPSVVHWLPQYAQLGIHGVSIGSNDLTQLMLGVDRDSDICSELFDTMDEAVLDAIDHIVERASAAGLHTSLCGQAASNDPKLVEHLVRKGIASVSVDPTVAELTRRTVSRAEHRIILDAAAGRAPR
ncbi:MAG TPA: phosphoenolpyruvate synthase [Acidimicrobiales bacterium]|jgi:pyruvate,water dikinase|nr:phosphoenolpyruvate synthase [Acidimicrobiales bacterium]